jgi:hypothetical protein
MKRTFPVLLGVGVIIAMTAVSARASDAKAEKLADEVVAASGGANWPKVSEIIFTFNVAAGSVPKLAAKHDWNVKTGMDKVSWKGKTVTVNVFEPTHTGDELEAYKRWVNDSYWLLMPLKLKDHGVNLESKESVTFNGKPCEVIQLSFGKVGLTTGDRYNLYINPETHRVDAFDYMPNPATKINASWTNYVESGGLTLSTEHVMGDNHIWISDLMVR